MQSFPLKFVLVGDTRVGKSQLSKRFVRDEFADDSVSTLGMEFHTKVLPFERCTLNAQIWDLAGFDRAVKMSAHFYKDAVGALLVYDICNRQSFENVKTIWLSQIKEFGHPNILIVLVGNKLDKAQKPVSENEETTTHRAVPVEEAMALAKEMGVAFVEVSAKTGENVNIAFRRVIYSVGSVLPPVRVHLDVLQLPAGWVKTFDVSNPLYMNYWTGDVQSAVPLIPATHGMLYIPEPRSSVSAAASGEEGSGSPQSSRQGLMQIMEVHNPGSSNSSNSHRYASSLSLPLTPMTPPSSASTVEVAVNRRCHRDCCALS